MATEQQVDDVIIELKELTRTLKSTSSTGASGSSVTSADKGVNRIVNAISLLAATIKGETATRRQAQKSIQAFAQEVGAASRIQERQAREANRATSAQRNNTDAIEDETGQVEKLINEQKKQIDAITRETILRVRQRSTANSLFNELERGATVGGVLKNKFEDLAGNSITGSMALKTLTATVSGAGSALMSMTASIYKGERGASVAAKAFTDLVKPLTDTLDTISSVALLIGWFAPIGKIGKLLGMGEKAIKAWVWGIRGAAVVSAGTSVVLKASAKAYELGAERADVLFRSFNDISKVGAALPGTLGGVADLMQTLGMTVSEIEEFNSIVRTGSKDLAVMGGTVGRGLKQFADITGELYKGDLGRELQNLGVMPQEMRALAMENLSIQARAGQLDLRNTEKLVKETAKFVKELDLAAQITGESREEQAKRIKSTQMDERFRAAQRKAEITGNETAALRLKNAAKISSMFGALGDPETEKGLQHLAAYFAETGSLAPGISQEATKVFYTYGADAIKNALETGSIEGFSNLVKSGGRLSDATLTLQTILGKFDPLVKGVGLFDAQRVVAELERAKADAKFNGTLDDFLTTTKEGQAAADKMRQTMVNTTRSNQNSGLTMDQAVNSMMDAAKISEFASQKFSEAVNQFREVMGVKATPGGLLKVGPAAGVGTAPGGLPPGGTPTTVSAINATKEAEKAKLKATEKQKALTVAKDQLKVAEDELQQMLINKKSLAEVEAQRQKIKKLQAAEVQAEQEVKQSKKDSAKAQNVARLQQQEAKDIAESILYIEKDIQSTKERIGELHDKRLKIEKFLNDNSSSEKQKASDIAKQQVKIAQEQLQQMLAGKRPATNVAEVDAQREKIKQLQAAELTATDEKQKAIAKQQVKAAEEQLQQMLSGKPTLVEIDAQREKIKKLQAAEITATDEKQKASDIAKQQVKAAEEQLQQMLSGKPTLVEIDAQREKIKKLQAAEITATNEKQKASDIAKQQVKAAEEQLQQMLAGKKPTTNVAEIDAQREKIKKLQAAEMSVTDEKQKAIAKQQVTAAQEQLQQMLSGKPTLVEIDAQREKIKKLQAAELTVTDEKQKASDISKQQVRAAEEQLKQMLSGKPTLVDIDAQREKIKKLQAAEMSVTDKKQKASDIAKQQVKAAEEQLKQMLLGKNTLVDIDAQREKIKKLQAAELKATEAAETDAREKQKAADIAKQQVKAAEDQLQKMLRSNQPLADITTQREKIKKLQAVELDTAEKAKTSGAKLHPAQKASREAALVAIQDETTKAENKLKTYQDQLGEAKSTLKKGAAATDPFAGLNVKSPESVAGGTANPRLIELARKIQEQYPSARFTAFNDLYHQTNKPGSKHTTGEAVDFTVDPAPQSAQEAAAIKDMVRSMGFSKVLDEYYSDANQNTKGGHFHAELAKGGVVSGPRSGYAATLHGTEAVVPLPDGKTIPVKIENPERMFQGVFGDQIDAMNMQISKLDEMVTLMRRQLNTSERMLQVSTS